MRAIWLLLQAMLNCLEAGSLEHLLRVDSQPDSILLESMCLIQTVTGACISLGPN